MQEKQVFSLDVKFLNYFKRSYCINSKITIVNNQVLNDKAKLK